MKRIALVGSSGGHLFVLGGKDPQNLLGEIAKQAEAAEMELSHIVFISASESLDNITKSTRAGVWVGSPQGLEEVFAGTLEEANAYASTENDKLAVAIREGQVDGLILVSADVKGLNQPVLDAAAEMKIPVAGTGGTSMADARAMGANVISASGTTGSTNRTRAVGYLSAFASHWKLKYTPIIGKVQTAASGGSFMDRISLRSIMMSSLPAFIAMALILALGKIPALSESVGPLFDTLIGMLPIVVAVVAAKQVSGLEEVGIVAGVIAGALSVNGGILGGILGGVLAGVLANSLLTWSFKMRFPATTASLVAGAISGLAAGLLIYFVLAPVALFLGMVSAA